MSTTLRKRLERAYDLVDAGGRYWALYYDGAAWNAWTYADGDHFADRGSTTDVGIGTNVQPTPVHEDVRGYLQPGSFVFGEGEELRVWDVAANAVYSRSAAGWINAGAVFAGGYVWWMESSDPSDPATTRTVRLMRANGDLTGVTAIGTHEVTVTEGFALEPVEQLSLTPFYAFAHLRYTDGEVVFHRRVGFGRDGGALVDDVELGADFDVQPNLLSVGIPCADATSAYAYGVNINAYANLWKWIAGGSDLPLEHWPEAWDLAGVGNISTSRDGSELAVYCTGGASAQLVRAPRQSYVGSSSAPPISFTVNPAPGADVPTWMFIGAA